MTVMEPVAIAVDDEQATTFNGRRPSRGRLPPPRWRS